MAVPTWKVPVAPRVGRIFSDWQQAQDHSKPHAADTPFRFSDAMSCARSLGYKAAGVPESDPFDGASLVVTAMGSLLHEDIQAAYGEQRPDALFETKSAIDDLTSGHIDIDDEDADEAIEIKTVGAYKFDQAVGISRKSRKLGPPKGPGVDHICQAGFNARARGRRNVRIVYLSREAVSVGLADQLGINSIDRISAEWLILPEVWEPIVDAEIERLSWIRESVRNGQIPDRQDFDNGESVTPNPTAARPFWRCNGYCQFRTRCVADGPGMVPVPVTVGRTR